MSRWPTDPPRRSRWQNLQLTWTILSLLIALIAGGYALITIATRQYGLIASQSNLRQIGMALKMYANANASQYPDDFRQLLLSKDVELTPEVFTTPFSPYDDTRRTWPTTMRARLLVTPGAAECKYIYAAAGLKASDLPPDAVVAIEQPEMNTGRFANILTADNSVELLHVADDPTHRAIYDRIVSDFANGVSPVRRQAATAPSTQP